MRLVAATASPQCEQDPLTGECLASDAALGSAMLQVSQSKALAPAHAIKITEDEQAFDAVAVAIAEARAAVPLAPAHAVKIT
jgi:hypothetical protein